MSYSIRKSRNYLTKEGRTNIPDREKLTEIRKHGEYSDWKKPSVDEMGRVVGEHGVRWARDQRPVAC